MDLGGWFVSGSSTHVPWIQFVGGCYLMVDRTKLGITKVRVLGLESLQNR